MNILADLIKDIGWFISSDEFDNLIPYIILGIVIILAPQAIIGLFELLGSLLRKRK